MSNLPPLTTSASLKNGFVHSPKTFSKKPSFDHDSINYQALKERAFNLRWATVPNGVLPLTAADPDFPVAPEIAHAIQEYAKVGVFSYGPSEGLPSFKEAAALVTESSLFLRGLYRLSLRILILMRSFKPVLIAEKKMANPTAASMPM